MVLKYLQKSQIRVTKDNESIMIYLLMLMVWLIVSVQLDKSFSFWLKLFEIADMELNEFSTTFYLYCMSALSCVSIH